MKLNFKKLFLSMVILGTLNIGLAKAELHCESKPEVNLPGEYVNLTISKSIYTILHYGHSRNSYSAEYAEKSSTGTRFGHSTTLVKIKDDSTWQDMPNFLKIDYYVTNPINTYILSGLTNIGKDYVYFDQKSCGDEDLAVNPKDLDEIGCFKGLQQFCGNRCISARATCNY